MKKKLRIVSFSLVFTMLIVVFAGCGQQAETESTAQTSSESTVTSASSDTSSAAETSDIIAPDWEGATLTLGTLNPENNPDSMGAQWFADQLYEKTGGRLKINVFSGSQLGNQTAQIESLVMGTQDMFIGGLEPFASIATELRALNVFFLFESQDQFQRFFKSEWWDNAQSKLAENNIVCINQSMNWVKGPFRIILSSKKIDGSLAAMKGMKIRIPDDETFQKSFEALGMVPVVVALNETYLALQQGLVEAVDLVPASIKSNGFQEVTKYILKTDAFPQREGVMMSKSALEKLPEEIQQLIYETADEAGDYYSQLVIDTSDSVLKEVQDMGIVYIDDADLSEWHDACSDLGYQFEESGYLPEGITDAINAMK